MEVVDTLETLKVLDASLRRTNWRLKASSKLRLETDILALCTGMRPVIMIDYGGKMPELRDRLCAFLKLSQEMITEVEKISIGAQFTSLQKQFSSVFCDNATTDDVSKCRRDSTSNAESSDCPLPVINQRSDFIDLSHFMQDTLVTLPTLNGWLLGYPVVYIFGKDHIEDAVYNLSTKSLHLFNIFVRRNSSSSKKLPQEELMSFSVPYDLSIDGENEAWAEAFLARMKARWEECRHVWGLLRMEVSATYPQAIAL